MEFFSDRALDELTDIVATNPQGDRILTALRYALISAEPYIVQFSRN